MENILSNFSKWVQWENRNELEGLNSQGVYVLKNSERNGSPFVSLDDSLLYIGETCGQALSKRLRQFNRSAFQGVGGHSGGRSFFAHYNLDTPPSWLYVTIFSVQNDEPKSSAYIRYIERYLLWQYVCFHNALPQCNNR